jgi:hypothetical protein
MTRTNKLMFWCCLIACVLAATTLAAPAQVTVSEDGNAIFQRVDQENARRAAKLSSYTAVRHYSVYEPKRAPDADVTVNLKFVPPSTKSFDVVSKKGVGFIQNLVFNRLMDTEKQTAQGKDKADSSISPRNYEAHLLREEEIRGRNSYILELTPKRQDKYLFNGKVWVDQQDYAITKIEGDPVKSPSWFVKSAHFVRDYQKMGDLWLPLRDETHCQIRFEGEYVLSIDHGDYNFGVGD